MEAYDSRVGIAELLTAMEDDASRLHEQYVAPDHIPNPLGIGDYTVA